MKHLTEFWVEEMVDQKTATEETKKVGSSFYRGAICNYMPDSAAYHRPEFLREYVLNGWLPSRRMIGKETKITAFGSCFAGNITNHLMSLGFSLSRERNPDVYISAIGEGLVNVHTLAQQFEWALEDRPPPQGLWHGYKGEEFGYDEDIRRRTRDVLLDTDFFILTFGLSEVWYDEPTGGVFWRAVPIDKYDPARHKFRVCSFTETRQQIARIYELIRKHVPKARLLATLSPIPLIATFRPISALTASSASKAILRAALDEFIREHQAGLNERLFYFPSFEIVTELFASRYRDDGHHPPYAIIEFIMKLFEATYCDTAITFEDVARLFHKVRSESAHDAVAKAAGPPQAR